MKKTLVYAAVAVTLGLMLTLIPLITVAELKPYYNGGPRLEPLQKLEGTRASISAYSASDIEIITICFIMALAVYLWSKHRMPSGNRDWMRQPPY